MEEASGRAQPNVRAGVAAESSVDVDWVRAARDTAAAGDPIGMLEALHKSHILDGLARYVSHLWGKHLDRDDIHTIIGRAVDAFYERVSNGERIREPKAYLYRTSLNLAYDENQRKIRHVPLGDAHGVEDARADVPQGQPIPREKLRERALAIARGLLPRLGQENIRRVMKYVFEAIEKGVEDVPRREIAEALGLSEVTVRQCLHRGFRRLKRAAREQGITLEDVLEEMEEQSGETEAEEKDDYANGDQ